MSDLISKREKPWAESSSSLFRVALCAALALACMACELPEAENEAETASADESEPPGLPTPDPGGITFYSWDQVHAAGRLDWAWAIAVDYGNLEQVARLLADGVDPDVLIGGNYQASSAPREHGRTALMIAASLGYDELARQLLAAGADPLVREISELEHLSGDTALHEAASSGHAGIVRLLLDAGVPVDVEGRAGATPLSSAHHDLGKRQYGYTPLWSAAVGGREEIALLLLEHGADPHVTPASGDLVKLAREAGHESIALLIERARAGLPLRPPVEDPG
jgi:hypothetical protein